MRDKTTIISLLVVIVLLAGTIAYMVYGGGEGPDIDIDILPQEGIDNLNKFSSVQDIKEFLKENSGDGYYGGGFGVADSVETFAAGAPAAFDGAAESAGVSTRSASASDYSETNIQVEGVDEPDIVKNDGKYIYTISGNKVVIVDAYPAQGMEILSEIEMEETPRNIFINDDKLIVFTQSWEYIDTGIRCGAGIPEIGVPCGGYSKQEAVVYIYDVSSRENPELDKEIRFDGDYRDARMIGDYVYLVSVEYIDLRFFNLPSYTIDGVETRIAADEISYFGARDSNFVFNSISAIDVDSGDVETEVYLLGSSSSIYVSEDNLYLNYMKSISQKQYFEAFVDEVLLEIMPASERRAIRDIMEDSELDLREKQEEIGDIVEDYFEDFADSDDLIEFTRDYQDRIEEFALEMQEQGDRTIVHKIEIDEDDIDYVGKGEVPGRVLNQFSMDEHGGYFRIATTTGGWRSDNNLNNLYVLDEDMEIVGIVEDLAKGERIYSARFMGERAYMVTFRQVDPLFVVDLSNPEQPEVLGELKVTGYSSYLHPYDENHLIGIGMEADEQGRTTGLKIALFDVSDVRNPKEKAKYTLDEGRWSYSEALYDHKAFLFDKERELLVIPVSYSVEDGKSERGYTLYRNWQGAYVLNIDAESIGLRGQVSHREDTEEENYGWYRGGTNVRRSLYMDDVLYTISDTKIKANGLDNLDDIDEVELPYSNYYGDRDYAIAVSEPAILE